MTDLTVAEATARVLGELTRMGIDRRDVVISTNLALRLDGLPCSGQAPHALLAPPSTGRPARASAA